MKEALFLTFLHAVGAVYLAPAAKTISRFQRSIYALPIGLVLWALTLLIAVAVHAHAAFAFWLLVLGLAILVWRTSGDHPSARWEELRWLAVGSLVVFFCAFGFHLLGFVSASYDSIAQLVLGRAFVISGFNPEIVAQFGSWGILVPALQGTSVLLGLGYLKALSPMLGGTALVVLYNAIRTASITPWRQSITLTAAAIITALIATTYFVVFQFGYIHNSLPSALFLLISADALWKAANGRGHGWLILALPALLGFVLARTEAPVFAAMLLVLAFSVGHEFDAARAWKLVVLPYAVLVVLWYSFLAASIGPRNDIMTPNLALGLIGITLATAAVLGCRGWKYVGTILSYAPLLVCVTACSLFAGAFLYDANHSFVDVASIVSNLSEFGRWGATWVVLALVLVAAGYRLRFKGEAFFAAFILGFISIIVTLGLFRVPYRLGWGDSANRIFAHLLFFAAYYLGIKLTAEAQVGRQSSRWPVGRMVASTSAVIGMVGFVYLWQYHSELQTRLMRGQPVTLAFDACTGNIGTIGCGRDYEIRYAKGPDERWCATVTGFNAGQSAVIKHVTCAGDPERSLITVFGALFSFDSRGRTFISDTKPHRLVGHLRYAP